MESALAVKPQVTMDDGADLLTLLHTKHSDLLPDVVGGTEETTTGVIRLTAMSSEGQLKYPVIAVNDAETKHFFDNRYGTGQSTLDGGSSFPAMGGAAVVLPRALRAWVRTSLYVRPTRSAR